MQNCKLCRFPAELDDVALGQITGGYVCLRCFHAAAATTLTLSKRLQQLIEGALAEVEEAA